LVLSYIIAFSYSTENNIVNTDNNEDTVNEIVVAKKIEEDSCYILSYAPA
jgi:hypothetical protein